MNKYIWVLILALYTSIVFAAEDYITPYYTWQTGDTITNPRLNGNNTAITGGLSGGTKAINVGKVLMNGTTVINNARAITATTGTFSSTLGVSGNTTISGTLTVPTINSTGLVTSLNAKVPYTGATGNVNLGAYGLTAATLAGTLATAAQPNITSLGTLTGLSIGGTQTAYGTDLEYRIGDDVNNYGGFEWDSAANQLNLVTKVSGSKSTAIRLLGAGAISIPNGGLNVGTATGSAAGVIYSSGSQYVKSDNDVGNGIIDAAGTFSRGAFQVNCDGKAGKPGLSLAIGTTNGGNLYLDAANTLKTDDSLNISGNATITGTTTMVSTVNIVQGLNVSGNAAISGTMNVVGDIYAEKGTYTPVITSFGGGGTVPQYSSLTGIYRKVGKLVTVWVNIGGDGGNEGSGTQFLCVSLPFTPSTAISSLEFGHGRYRNNATYASISVTSLGSSAAFTVDSTGAAIDLNAQNNASRSISFTATYETN